ncbi:MAG: tRNA (cytidine(34)-2'-O)-methyltransferase [Mycoplasma sp.]
MKINVILFEPEIPENTGNIARSCVGFGATLHLIRPYGFILNSSKLKRSGVNYWENLNYHEYDSFDQFLEMNNNPERIIIYSRYGKQNPSNIKLEKDQEVFIMFGKESSGVPNEILEKYLNYLVRVPTTPLIRSLNLSNTVAIALYEVSKQNDFEELSLDEPHNPKF